MSELDALRARVVAHYERALAEHGPTARGMDWKDEESQRIRFDVLCGIGPLDGLSLHDVGAGAGHLLDHLRARGSAVRYSGSDLSERMLAAARARHPGVPFHRRDLLAEGDEERSDLLFCSGLFHVKLAGAEAEWADFVRRMLRRMYGLCEVGIAFNLMSDLVDWRDERLYYADPGATLEFCRRELSRHVALRHDYPLHEFTVYVYREPRRA